jgi:hypothetical protein
MGGRLQLRAYALKPTGVWNRASPPDVAGSPVLMASRHAHAALVRQLEARHQSVMDVEPVSPDVKDRMQPSQNNFPCVGPGLQLDTRQAAWV